MQPNQFYKMFQSTFPQGERQNSELRVFGTDCFNPRSRKGNDVYRHHSCMFVGVSIHVPARGTTAPSRSYSDSFSGFNPRSRKGNDPICIRIPHFCAVSIHVPARGTTLCRMWCCLEQIEFQSTFPQGERLNITPIISICKSFNPRSRKGNDGGRRVKISCLQKVSIHVPARGTTTSDDLYDKIMGVSIHVPARGTTCCSQYRWSSHSVSIHVPARGTT